MEKGERIKEKMDCVKREGMCVFSLVKGNGSVLYGIGIGFAEFVERPVFCLISAFTLHFGDSRTVEDNENSLLSLGNRVNWVIRVH